MSKRAIKVIFPAEALVGKLANLSRSTSQRYGSIPAFVGYQRRYGPQNMFQVKMRTSTTVSQSQVLQRNIFTVATNTARTWLADPTKQLRIVAAFRKQVNNVDGYGTINGFAAAKIVRAMDGTATAPDFDTTFPAA